VTVLLLAPAIANAGASTQHRVRLGSPLALPPGATPLAAVAAAVPMRVTVVLAPRDASGLARYARAVADPRSSVFRHYLSRARFASMFAPSPRVVANVRSSLRAHGLATGRLSANGLSLPVRATVGALERGFSLSLAAVRLRRGKTAVLNTTAPAVDASVASSIQAVVGLSSLSPAVPLLRSGRDARAGAASAAPAVGIPRPCAAAAAAGAANASGPYTADGIASAYGFDPLYEQGDQGQGATIAVYELESYDPADIQIYQACYRTGVQIRTISVDGGPRPAGGPGTGEAALDIEQLISLVPRARLLVYQGPNSLKDSPGSGPYDTLSEIISQDAAQVITTSWGQCETAQGARQAAAENVLLEEAAVQGQTVVAAAGDDGAQDCTQPGVLSDIRLAVDDPASQPFVTGVGGTSLLSLGPPPVEQVWNSSLGPVPPPGATPGAGAGGISALWTMPAYQSSAPGPLNVAQSGISSGFPCGARSGLCREVPDVSADADPATGYVFYFNGSGAEPSSTSGWQPTGGTSGAAPVWAAVFALADASHRCAGRAIGFANPSLYQIAAASGEGTAEAGPSAGGFFNDVLRGNNDFTHTSGSLYAATSGYDMASGLGSPDAAPLAEALCASTLSVASPGSQRAFVRTRHTVSLNVADAPGSKLHFSASGLPKGLVLDPDHGVISGRPQFVGSSIVTVTVTDTSGTQRRIAFRWTVEGRPVVKLARLSQPVQGRPLLRLALAAGAEEPGLRTLTLTMPPGLQLAARVTRSLVVASQGRPVRFGALLTGRTLTLTVVLPRRSIQLALSAPWLRVSPGLTRAGSVQIQSPLGLEIADSGGGVTRLRVRLSR
jgi:subtilase family serine protease